MTVVKFNIKYNNTMFNPANLENSWKCMFQWLLIAASKRLSSDKGNNIMHILLRYHQHFITSVILSVMISVLRPRPN